MVDNTPRDIPSVTLSIDGGINLDTDKIANLIFGQNIEISQESIHALTSQFTELLQNGHVMSSLDGLAMQMFAQAVQKYGDPEAIQALSGFAEGLGLPIPELGSEATPESAPAQRMAIVGHGSDVVEPRSAPSDDVKEMQQALVDAGFDVGSYPDGRPMVDGQEGTLTRDAAMAAAEAMGISEEELRSMPIDEFTQRLDEYEPALENSRPQNAPVPGEPPGEPENANPEGNEHQRDSRMSIDDALRTLPPAQDKIPQIPFMDTQRMAAEELQEAQREYGPYALDDKGTMYIEFEGREYVGRMENGDLVAADVTGLDIAGLEQSKLLLAERDGMGATFRPKNAPSELSANAASYDEADATRMFMAGQQTEAGTLSGAFVVATADPSKQVDPNIEFTQDPAVTNTSGLSYT